uniref:WLGC domain-containing protein n=1 Tax=Globisporangium ultimum (strain ATCC 200006 / CBS 805.95 / DAOM BR144) TaxID=431595 RepID=K3WCA2_GLOUD
MDVSCGGILYQKCVMGNSTGICFNSRMAVVSYDVSGFVEKMWRLQITLRVGIPCDAVEEA